MTDAEKAPGKVIPIAASLFENSSTVYVVSNKIHILYDLLFYAPPMGVRIQISDTRSRVSTGRQHYADQ